MTLAEYNQLEQEFSRSEIDIKTFLEQKEISYNTYYYWKRKSRDLKEESSATLGQFLPIEVHSGGAIKPSKRNRNIRQPIISQGEIENELRTLSGAEIRIRGYMDSIMVSTIIASGGRRNVISYTYTIFPKLSRYYLDGRYRIDNNLVENAIRPLAIGRKNYLFCGNAEAATRASMIYSLLGTCKAAGVNPSDWLQDVLSKIHSFTKSKRNLEELLPHIWKKNQTVEK